MRGFKLKSEDLKFGLAVVERWGCRAVGERLGDCARGHLTEAERDAVAYHLHGCAACREALALEQTLAYAAKACTGCAVPDTLAASVLEARHSQDSLDVLRRVLGFQRASCMRFAFRAFVDPLLWAEYWVHYTFAPVRSGMAVVLVAVHARLLDEMLHIGEQIATPIKLAYRQLCEPLVGKICYFG